MTEPLVEYELTYPPIDPPRLWTDRPPPKKPAAFIFERAIFTESGALARADMASLLQRLSERYALVLLFHGSTVALWDRLESTGVRPFIYAIEELTHAPAAVFSVPADIWFELGYLS